MPHASQHPRTAHGIGGKRGGDTLVEGHGGTHRFEGLALVEQSIAKRRGVVTLEQPWRHVYHSRSRIPILIASFALGSSAVATVGDQPLVCGTPDSSATRVRGQAVTTGGRVASKHSPVVLALCQGYGAHLYAVAGHVRQ